MGRIENFYDEEMNRAPENYEQKSKRLERKCYELLEKNEKLKKYETIHYLDRVAIVLMIIFITVLLN